MFSSAVFTIKILVAETFGSGRQSKYYLVIFRECAKISISQECDYVDIDKLITPRIF